MPQFVLRQAIVTLASILDGLLWLYSWILIIAILLTWVNPDPSNPIVRFFYSVTEPVLYWTRRRFPFLVIGRVDISPIVLFVAITFVRSVLVASLYELAARIGMAALAAGHVG
ncbi:MAG TPA: YggT family protein [Candidatus Binatia bacterium]|nr:YggT family protein [Candidatus Binatia bacterium]